MAQEGRNREQDETGCQQPAGRIPCANNCGFLGSEATMNLCSKCYGEVVLKKADAFPTTAVGERSIVSVFGEKALFSLTQEEMPNVAAVKSVLPVHSVQHEQLQFLLFSGGSSSGPSEQGESLFAAVSVQEKKETPRTPNRCLTCRKRVGLTGFKCRCGDVFCTLHRYSDKHNCTFDYKAAARDAITKANPVVKADKIKRI